MMFPRNYDQKRENAVLNHLSAIEKDVRLVEVCTHNIVVCFKWSLEGPRFLLPYPDCPNYPYKIENFCLDCEDPVHGLFCRRCAPIRKTLEELFLQDASESSDDNTNVVNAPREPFVVKQGPGVDSSQSPPLIDHNCCYECGDSLDGIFCQRCTCKSCGKGTHIGYNCPPKSPIISNPEPWQSNNDELPQTLPSFDPTCYSEKENSLPYVSKPNFVDNSPNVFNPPPQPPTYSYENYGNDAYYGYDCSPQVPFIYPEPCYKGKEEKRIAKEQALKIDMERFICYDDDDNKVSVENLDLVRTPRVPRVIPDSLFDCLFVTIPPYLKLPKEHSETIIDSNNDSSSSDDNSYENIDYVDASPPDSEIESVRVWRLLLAGSWSNDTDIHLTIKDISS
ncbi:hypothetical protein Tco_0786486 [Tanacetum coccineum]